LGAFSGPLTVSKLWVRGELPDGFRDRFIKHLRLRTFQPLTADDDADERVGWCVVGSPLELELGHENVYYGSYLAVGVRADRWRLPTTVLKAELAEATRAALAKSGRERLTKAEKDDLKQRVATRLKKKLLPSMRAADFVWNLDAGVAYFFKQSAKAIEQLSVLFEATFGLELALDCPYLAAVERRLGDSELEVLAAVEPAPLHTARK
jgi:hypothetical protein